MAPDLLQRFEKFYQDFGHVDLSGLELIYAPDLLFLDPVHAVRGLPALRAYFENTRENVSHCAFEFENRAVEDNRAFFQWRMDYAHPRIESGRLQWLRGCTMIEMQDQIVYHEDFYDLGAMLYEHIPVLGWAVRKIKKNLASG